MWREVERARDHNRHQRRFPAADSCGDDSHPATRAAIARVFAAVVVASGRARVTKSGTQFAARTTNYRLKRLRTRRPALVVAAAQLTHNGRS